MSAIYKAVYLYIFIYISAPTSNNNLRCGQKDNFLCSLHESNNDNNI